MFKYIFLIQLLAKMYIRETSPNQQDLKEEFK